MGFISIETNILIITKEEFNRFSEIGSGIIEGEVVYPDAEKKAIEMLGLVEASYFDENFWDWAICLSRMKKFLEKFWKIFP